jgi:hypothetical protein
VQRKRLMRDLGAVTYPPPSDPKGQPFAAVVEQIICAMADFFIAPPGVGAPLEEELTSNFSLFVIEQRRLWGKAGKHTLCCGASPGNTRVAF